MKKGYNMLILKALDFFIENSYEEIHLREFSRRIGISPNSSQRFLNFFLKNDFIIEERKANLRYFKANLDNLVFRHIKITYSLQKIKESKLIDNLADKFTSVVVFGSIAKGLDDKKSDIDLVCIGNAKDINFEDYEDKLGKTINSHIFTLLEWKKQKDKNKAFYQDVITEGINLIGQIQIIE